MQQQPKPKLQQTNITLLLFTLLIIITSSNGVLGNNVDPLGYIAYCPCMGRFGNQADHFLGALAFAHGLNRTLVLPPWVEYRYGEPKSIQVPFSKYFDVETLRLYHKVIEMEVFMEEVAPIEWPPGKRIAFCYMSRGDGNTCNAKEGNPFGPFWDTFSIDFVGSEFYGPLHYDTHNHDMAAKWNKKYPPLDWPVLAFTGAPASFPVQSDNVGLHAHLSWSREIDEKATRFVRDKLPGGAFIGIHLRNGADWGRACSHIPQSPNLFAAPQCLGYKNERGPATMDMCMPTKETILRQLKRTIKNYNSRRDKSQHVRTVFVASDNNHMLGDLTEGLKRMKVAAFKYTGEDGNGNNNNSPHVDLAILGKANHFVGNCISSYSAFVKRERDCNGFPSTFWAFPTEKSSVNAHHDEL